MIQSIMQIGKWNGKLTGMLGSLDNFVQNPNDKGNIQKVFTILLNRNDDGSYFYSDVDVEEFSFKKLTKYLYRKGSSRGSDITPTSKFAGDVSKTFNGKILKNIKDIVKNGTKLGIPTDAIEDAQRIDAALTQASDEIIIKLTEKAEELDTKEGALFTLVFQQNGKNQYVGDIELFRTILKEKAKEKYYKKYNKIARSSNQKCFVCLNKKSEVYGFVNTYNFYTVDKPGFVTGGFKQQDAWKNYPVCYECASSLELGKNYLHTNLNFSFYSFNYLLIPKFFNNKDIEETLDILKDAFESRADEIIKTAFERNYIRRLTDAEGEIFKYLSEMRNPISFDLLFYGGKQNAFNILLHVEDMVPSRFKKLFELKEKLDNLSIFKNEVAKDGKRLVLFNFGVLRNFFPYVSKKFTYNKNFLELTEKIFSLKPVNYNFVMNAIVRRLRSKFVNNQYLRGDCLQGWLLLNYLAGLGILNKGGKIMDVPLIKDIHTLFDSGDKTLLEKIELFFDVHNAFFDNAPKKAAFLVGVLVQKLINIQLEDRKGQKRKVAPFRKKLNGLRLTEASVKKISYEAQEKLEQYGKNYYKNLEAVIAQYMVTSGAQWNALTNDEISFYFTMGMNLAGLFKSEKKNEEGDDDKPE